MELVDFGDAARLERFGARLVDRPHPSATGARREPTAWLAADLRFDRDGGWSGPAVDAGPWLVTIDDLTLQLRPTEAGQVGLFPEHVEALPWLYEQVERRLVDAVSPPAVLHMFAYTGLASLAMARSGAAVTHVDASKPAVTWSRANAESSDLADRSIRWIVDDARGFAQREARRGRQYAGIVLDPPTYGHGSGGRAWRIETDLEPLLTDCHAVLDPNGFVLLTAHSASLGPDDLGTMLVRALHRRAAAVEVGTLGLTTRDGRRLDLGVFARSTGGQ